MTTPLRLHDGAQVRTITGRTATMIRRLLEHEEEINRHATGSVEFHFGGPTVKLKMYVELNAIEGGGRLR